MKQRMIGICLVASATLAIATLSGCASVPSSSRPNETFYVADSYQQVYYRLYDWVHTCHGKDESSRDFDVQGSLYGRNDRGGGKGYVSFSQKGQNLLNVGLDGNGSNTSVVASVLGQGPWNQAELTSIKQSLQHEQTVCAASGG
jgi:uncharacterized protein YceK